MFDASLFTDFELKCSDGKTLKAHKSILAARSPMFHAMLTTDMQESKNGSTEVPDFDSTTMKELLRFIYCNKVEGLKEKASKLAFAAEKYQIEELKQMCVESLAHSLTLQNVVEFIVIANSLSNATKLYNKCLDMINK